MNYFIKISFWGAIFFQLTGLKFIWSLEKISRYFNISLLLLFSGLTIYSLFSQLYSRKVWSYYLFPGILVTIGLFINITISTIQNPKIIGSYGLILSWIIYLNIPFLLKKGYINVDNLWKYFYHFMVIAVLLALFDYINIYLLKNTIPRILYTSHGVFLGGNFSILYMLEDGTPYNRFYACILEPGSLAMLLLPLLYYAWLFKKRWGFLVLLLGFYLTNSFGGLVGGLQLLLGHIVIKGKKYSILPIVLLTGAILVVYLGPVGDKIQDMYIKKGESREVREKNVMSNLPQLIIENPLGLTIEETTESMKRNKSFKGTNFIPGNYLQNGGVLAFLGYLGILSFSIFYSVKNLVNVKKLKIEEQVVYLSMLVFLSFLVQRTTIWESALLPFLYSPIILRSVLSKKQQ